MPRITLLFFFILVVKFDGFGQERFLKKAKEAIQNGEYYKAEGHILAYESKENEQPQSTFLRYQLKLKTSSLRFEGLDSAFNLLKKAIDGFSAIPLKDRSDLCEDINYCEQNFISESRSLDSLIFHTYAKNNEYESIDKFIQKYPSSSFNDQAKELRSHLAFLEAKKVNTEKAYSDYISKFYGYKDVELATSLMWQVGFVAAEKENTITAYEDFIRKYPKSSEVTKAKSSIWTIAWQNALNENTRNAFVQFSSKYADAPQYKEAIEKIVNIDWAQATKLNTVLGYKDFNTKHPGSIFQGEALKRIENIAWDNAKSSGTINVMNSFIATYPNSTFVSEAQQIIENLQSLVYPYILKNRKYRLYNPVVREFVGNDEYDNVEILNNGFFRVEKFDKFGIVDKKANQITKITYDCVSGFNNGVATVSLGGKSGLVNDKGEQLLPLIYDGITELSNGFYVLTKDLGNANRKQGICNTKGEISVDFLYDYIYLHTDEQLVAQKNGLTFVITPTGKILSRGYPTLSVAGKNSLIVTQKNLYSVVKFDGTILIPSLYTYITGTDSTGFIAILPDKKQVLFDQYGKEQLPPMNADIRYISDNIYAINRNSNINEDNPKIYLYNSVTKKYYNSTPYNAVGDVSEDFIWVNQQGKSSYVDVKNAVQPSISFNTNIDQTEVYGYMGEGDHEHEGEGDGEEVICYLSTNMFPSQTYENLLDLPYGFNEGYAALKINSKYGYINKKGEITIPFIYESATPFSLGIANVTIKRGDETVNLIINKEGKTLFTGISIDAFDLSSNIAILRKGEWQDGFEYFILDLSTMKISKSFQGYSNLTKYSNYYLASYKDLQVYITLDGDLLYESNINFTSFEANKINSQGSMLLISQKYQEALAKFQESKDLMSNNPDALLGLAKAYIGLKNYYEANDALKDLYNLDPNNQELYSVRIDMNIERSYWQEVINDSERLIELSTGYIDANIYFRKGYAENALSRYDQAISSYTKGAEINSYDSWVFNSRGLSYLQKGDYTKALQDFTTAIKKQTDGDSEKLGMYYNNRGVAFYRQNKKIEACSDYKKAAEFGNSNGISNYRNCK